MRNRAALIAGILIAAVALLACSISSAPPAGQPTATEFDLPTRTLEASATPTPGGVIAGSVNYPSEFIPAQRVAAYDAADFSVYFFVDTALNEPDFAIPVPAGTYYVVSYVLEGDLAGGYTQAVPCGLLYTCEDHSLIPIVVGPGETVTGITPSDWYAPEGAFPPRP